MSVAAIAMALIAAQMSAQQTALGATVLRMNADAAGSLAKVLSNTAQNSLANVAPGIGANLNIAA
jgi:hypothetical protein